MNENIAIYKKWGRKNYSHLQVTNIVFMTLHMKDDIMWHIFHQQRFLKQLICCGNHTNIIYPDLFIRYCENCFFLSNTFTFDSIVDDIYETNSFH